MGVVKGCCLTAEGEVGPFSESSVCQTLHSAHSTACAGVTYCSTAAGSTSWRKGIDWEGDLVGGVLNIKGGCCVDRHVGRGDVSPYATGLRANRERGRGQAKGGEARAICCGQLVVAVEGGGGADKQATKQTSKVW